MPLAHRRFTVEEYYRMADVGILAPDDRVELLEGKIVEMTPIGSRHAAVVTGAEELFHLLVGARATIRVQNPVRLSRYDEPEPDVALVARRADRYAGGHPTPADVLLIVEVADTSLAYDRDRKLPAYAEAGIPEVWLVDLTADRLEAYREPVGRTYRERRVFGREGMLTLLRLPGVTISASEMMG